MDRSVPDNPGLPEVMGGDALRADAAEVPERDRRSAPLAANPKVSLVSLGCPKNIVDAEVLLGFLAEAGYAVTADDKDADIVLVNTCCFIEPALDESRQVIEELQARRKNGVLGALIVTGCLPQRYRDDDLRHTFPWVDAFVGPGDLPRIVSVVEKCRSRRRVRQITARPRWLYDHRTPRFRVTLPHVAYVKIAEGCFHGCSFCLIPSLRGDYRSRRMTSVVEEIRTLADATAAGGGMLCEVDLVAQDTTAYGRDLYGRPRLTDLLKKILKEDLVPWIRLLYAYPHHLNGDLMDLLASEPSLCRYLDLPLQHISDSVLRRMRRGVTRKTTLQLLERLRTRVPDLTLRTTLLVGFPGETDQDFLDLLDFVATWKFERLGVFPFYAEEGTAAATLPDPVPEEVKEERLHALMTVQQAISAERNRERVLSLIHI